MMVSRLLLATTLAVCVAPRSDAQRVTPVALRSADAAMAFDVTTAAHSDMKQPIDKLALPANAPAAQGPSFNSTGTIVGGVLGGAAGMTAGFFLGAALAEGCSGEDCGLVPAVVGATIGETLGLAIGAHLGSRSTKHQTLVTSTLASVGVAAIGGLLAIPTGGAALFVVPIGQLAAVYAIESANR